VTGTVLASDDDRRPGNIFAMSNVEAGQFLGAVLIFLAVKQEKKSVEVQDLV
jgi:hypothetical protein